MFIELIYRTFHAVFLEIVKHIPNFTFKKITAIILGLMLSFAVGLSFAADKKHKSGNAQAKPNSRYVINGGEVYDQKTDLTWNRCSVGQHWREGTGCVGVIKEFTFGEALQLADGTWHVPNKDELGTLIDYERLKNKQPPMIDVVAFPDMDFSKLVYWILLSIMLML